MIPLPGRITIRLMLLLILLVSASCDEESPLGPEIDPLVGKWTGQFVSPIDGRTVSGSFTLTVQTGGLATGTGYTWQTINGVPVAETLLMEVEVTPDGSLLGEGRWFFVVFMQGYEGLAGAGSVTGSLEGATGTGSGELRAVFLDGVVIIPWEVTKEGGP